ncbi:MAG: TonB-dependent receptor domain-containing protein [Vicinamibacteraceae bacterium]
MKRSARTRRLSAVLVYLIVSLASSAAYAQYRASLQGTVRDPQGGVIPGATVTLTDTETNRTFETVTNESGMYVFTALAARTYSLAVELQGFKRKVLDDVRIIAEQSNALNVALELGGTTETVTVSDAAPLLDTATGNISGTVTAEQIQSLPSYGRDPFQLLQFAPGAFGDGARSAGGGTQNLPATTIGGTGNASGVFATENGGQIVANGARTGENNYQIDGVGVTSVSWGGTSVITPNEDSIKEIKIVTNNYDAEFGRYRGAQVQIISQNGTNDFHGSAFLRRITPGMSAFHDYNGYGKVPERNEAFLNDIGGTIGGPILRNRLFGFFSYETIRDSASNITQGWYQTPQYMSNATPSGSAAERLLSFPGASPLAGTALMGPNEGHTCTDIGLVQGVNCRLIQGEGLDLGRPLSPNRFPVGRPDPSFVDPFSPGLGGDGTGSPSNLDGVPDMVFLANANPSESTNSQYNMRVDFNATARDLIAFSMYQVPVSNDSINGALREMNQFHHTQNNGAETVLWNRTFSSTLLNEVRVNHAGWSWDDLGSNPDGPWGLPSTFIQNVDGSATLGTIEDNHLDFGIGAPGLFNQDTYGFKNVLTKVHNSHLLKMGGEVTYMKFVDTAPWSARPSYYFNNMWDFLNDAPSGENATFDPLTGVPTDFRKDTRQTLYALFVQDDWKVRNNLTLTLGLRWEYFGSISEDTDDLSAVVLGSGDATLSDLRLRLGGTLYESSKTDFGPQAGVAWTPTRFNGKMVVRGGVGLAYNGLDQAISLNGRSNAPFLSAAGNLTGSQIVYGVDSFPADVNSFSGYASNPATIAGFDPETNLPVPGPNFARIALTGFPAEWPTTRMLRYSVDAEYDLGSNWVASLGYQGSTTDHLTRQYNLNLVSAAQGIPLNPVVNQLTWYANDGEASFNALLAGIRHRFSNSFQLDAQYRLSRSYDHGSNNFAQDHYVYDPEAAWGPSDYDATHTFKLWGVWSPQLSDDPDSLLEKIAGGWTLSGIVNAHSAFPWTPFYGGLGCGVVYAESQGNCDLRPATYLGGALSDYSDEAFRRPGGNFPDGGPAYFTEPVREQGPSFESIVEGENPPGPIPERPGVERNSFRGPRYFNVDATIGKAFGLPTISGLGNNARLEIRANIYNVFNSVNLANLQTNIFDPHFSEAQDGLGGRSVEVQARFSF